MKSVEAIAFLAALRGVPLAQGVSGRANCWRKRG
jgi:hypothetical protein